MFDVFVSKIDEPRSGMISKLVKKIYWGMHRLSPSMEKVGMDSEQWETLRQKCCVHYKSYNLVPA